MYKATVTVRINTVYTKDIIITETLQTKQPLDDDALYYMMFEKHKNKMGYHDSMSFLEIKR